MGILDDVFGTVFDPFSGPGRTQRRGNRLFTEGTRSPGRLVGIRVRETSDAATDWWWTVDVTPAGGETLRAACRQALPPGVVLRLGMDVEVCHDARRVVLAWDPTGPGGWRPSRKLTDGIEDKRLPGPPRGSTAADAEVRGWRPASFMGLPRAERDVLLHVDGVGEDRKTLRVPEWATHLLATGTTLPVWRTDRKLAVDWLAALERHGPGVGVDLAPPTD